MNFEDKNRIRGIRLDYDRRRRAAAKRKLYARVVESAYWLVNGSRFRFQDVRRECFLSDPDRYLQEQFEEKLRHAMRDGCRRRRKLGWDEWDSNSLLHKWNAQIDGMRYEARELLYEDADLARLHAEALDEISLSDYYCDCFDCRQEWGAWEDHPPLTHTMRVR